MGKLILILTALAQIGFAQTRQNGGANDLNGFNDFLGKEKASALDATVKSFDNFLSLNYPDSNSENEKTRKFLEDLQNHLDSLIKWKFDIKENSKLLKLMETTGLRKEMLLYGYEDYTGNHSLDNLFPWPTSHADTLESIILEDLEEEIIRLWTNDRDSVEFQKRMKASELRHDSILNVNLSGQFLYGLAKFAPNDTSVQSFVEATFFMGGIPTSIHVNANLKNLPDFEEPFYKRIIVADIYYHILRIENEKETTTR